MKRKNKFAYWLGIKCPVCKTKAWSKRGGDFQTCECGKSFIDRMRWSAQMARVGGPVVNVTEYRIMTRRVPIKKHLKEIYK
jgi:hypothetical protein